MTHENPNNRQNQNKKNALLIIETVNPSFPFNSIITAYVPTMPDNTDPEVRNTQGGPKDDPYIVKSVDEEIIYDEQTEPKENGKGERRRRTTKRLRSKKMVPDTGEVSHHCLIL